MRLNKIKTIHIFRFSGRKFLSGIFLYLLLSNIFIFSGFSQNVSSRDTTTPANSIRFPIKENNHPFSNSGQTSPLILNPPSNIKQEIVYDPVTKRYEFSEKVGQLDYRPPSSMSQNEYKKYDASKKETDYWREKSNEASGTGPAFMKNLRLGSETLNKIFGTDVISIVPQGSAELIFGYSITKNKNPLVPVKSQKNGTFIFKEKIMMNVTGSIGDKLEIGLNYNTEATFDFENKTKLAYSGKEDEIVKKIEAGDITFSLPGSLITGSQSLFGIKTEFQFGKLNIIGVVSRQKGQSTSINVQGGAQLSNFEINAGDYDANRHFFLSHFFRDNYDEWLKNIPYIQSQVKIQQIEVWVVNKNNDFTGSRNIVAFMDLGEAYGPDGPPDDKNYMSDPDFTSFLNPKRTPNLPTSNSLNDLYSGIASKNEIRTISTADDAVNSFSGGRFLQGRDWQKLVSARPLSSREYTLNDELGYISLNSPLRNDEILAVAYTYTYKSQTYTVGELTQSQASPKTLIVKLLKGTVPSPKFPSWDLMMKNVYAIDAYQVSREGFVLNVLYRNDKTGVPVNYLSEGDTTAMSKNVNQQILLKVLELDNLDSRNEQNPDGIFDFVEGITINSKNGRIYFPILEPFGSDLRRKINDNDPKNKFKNRTADKYVFQELYDSTQTYAKQVAEKNKFFLKGVFKSSSGSDISLNAQNIPKGSVIVTAGGMTLTEGADYTVDYTVGRVKIINQGLLESGTPIKISLESNSNFNMQTKTLIGTHLNYKFSENFNVGATLLHLSERPMTQKVNMGDEPISNTIWGLNTSYRTSSQLLTTLVDKIPFINTKAPSNISVDAEFAELIPGESKTIGKNGIAYIDDFEASQTKIDLKSYVNWSLGSAPIGQNNLFEHGSDVGSLSSGYGRAKLSWYIIDPIFYSNQPPGGITDNDLAGNYVRRIPEVEIFKNKDNTLPGESYVSPLNVSYWPAERGPYNYDPSLNADGTFSDPDNRWGSMMRSISNSDFETSNIEYIEFWMMDPNLDSLNTEGGELYFQLGEISEDVLRDGQKSFENGLPTSPADSVKIDQTIFGLVPHYPALTNQFSSDPTARQYQDVGLDGLSDANEKVFFKDYVTAHSSQAADPSADDFQYFLDGDSHNIVERYKNFCGLENNSPASSQTGGRSSASKSTPDVEDINGDNTMNTTETYFQYRVGLTPAELKTIGQNHIVDVVQDSKGKNTWYQFRIPINAYDTKIGEIQDFKSIRFMRMVLTKFKKPTTLRFATLDLVRGDWRDYTSDLSETQASIPSQPAPADFEISAVNIEENANKKPVGYVLPPGIDRAIDPSQQQLQQLNEQSMLLKVRNLKDGDARAVFKNVQLDLRQYKILRMFIHAEELPDDNTLKDNDLTAFIRIGTDYQDNYYEYELPLKLTHPDPNNTDITVWPEENTIALPLDSLVSMKEARNAAMQHDPNITFQDVYPVHYGNRTIKVKGNPNLAGIRQIMIGVRNPNDASSFNSKNDGRPKSAELWFNELRVTDFNDKGGWAANGRVQIQLADFGVVNVAGSTSSTGFGSIEQKVEERSYEQTNQYNITSNLELGKFFPEKSNVTIPFFVGVSKTIINPEYYPKDPDIKLKDVLAMADTKAERDSIKKISQDVTSRKSINLTNVRWNKQFKKWKIFSPGNFSGGVAYSYIGSHNYSTDYNNFLKYGADINYVLSTRPKSIQPFGKSKSFKKPLYRIIRDINFTPYPSRFAFTTQMTRTYQEMKMRNVSQDVILKIDSTVSKDFEWNRHYDVRWDLTRSLKLDYTATNIERITEPPGASDFFGPDKQAWKDSVWKSILSGGQNMSYTQNFNASYNLPINKIPLFNWINIDASYGSTYNWVRGQDKMIGLQPLGNTLKNSNTMKLNGNLNLRGLYTKLNYFKKLDSNNNKNKTKEKENARFKAVQYSKQTFFKKDVPKTIIHKLKTEDVKIKVVGADGKEIEVKTTVVSENKVTVTASDDITGATITIDGKVPEGKSPLVVIAETTARLVTGFKSANASWTRTSGTLLPGYLPGTTYFGIDNSIKYKGAPGVPFAFGWQDWNIPYQAIDNGWLTTEPTFNSPIVFTRIDNFTYKTSYEPYNGFRIDLTGMRNYAETNEQLYFYENSKDSSNYNHYFIDHRYKGGNFTISTITIATSFEKVSSKNNWQSASFQRFENDRAVISQRKYNDLVNSNPNYQKSIGQQVIDGYYPGYGPLSQDVLVPAFLAAYTKTDPKSVSFSNFPYVALPNWRVSFDGLTKIAFLQKYFKTITLTHSYKSTYSIGSFATNTDFFDDNTLSNGDNYNGGFKGLVRNNQGDIIPQFQFSAVSINEQYSPLVGVSMTWINDLLTSFEYGKGRMIALSLSSYQVNESRDNSTTFGIGYRFKEVPFTLTTGGNRKQIKSDLNVKFDWTIKKNITIIRPLPESISENPPDAVTAGSKKSVISVTADYAVSKKFTIQLYYDRTVNDPYTSGSFWNSETNIGFSLRLSL